MTTNERLLARDLNEACMEAADKCPQSRGYWSGREESMIGTSVVVDKLHEVGLKAVIDYWHNTGTIGGHLLFKSGYYEELPMEYRNIFSDYRKFMVAATEDFCKNYLV